MTPEEIKALADLDTLVNAAVKSGLFNDAASVVQIFNSMAVVNAGLRKREMTLPTPTLSAIE